MWIRVSGVGSRVSLGRLVVNKCHLATPAAYPRLPRYFSVAPVSRIRPSGICLYPSSLAVWAMIISRW